MEGDALIPPPASTAPSIEEQSIQSSPSQDPSKVSKASLYTHETIRLQDSESKLSPKTKPIATRRFSPSANRIGRKQDATAHGGKLLRKTTWTSTELRTDIAADGASAGRDGRKFTVANVGMNGKMYLRPTTRPDQRYAQPQFSFPITPPGSAGLEALVARNEEYQESKVEDGAGSFWTPTRSPSTPTRRSARDIYFPHTKFATLPRAAHKRAHSYSTMADEQFSTLQDEDEGTFKIVIDRPRSSRGRPRTATQLSRETPTLEVPIPSYKLGTPRFSKRGTAFLRGSSYNGSYDERSSVLTMRNTLHPVYQGSDSTTSRRHSHTSRSPHGLRRNLDSDEPPLPSPAIKHGSILISPAMYNNLTFKPGCDDPSLVRYSGENITAAVPARLISEITSPCFLDYELLSDFFLTFRSYLTTSDLLLMMTSRLQWALERNDEFGMIVRVRTFVAIRHWILNYFVDDFVVDYDLRIQFCDLVNNLVTAIKQGLIRNGNQLKIVEELKKCWRRTCALFWDSPDFGSGIPAEVPLRPGGVFGHRNADLTPALLESLNNRPPQLDSFFLEQETSSTFNFSADVQRAADLDFASERLQQPEYAPGMNTQPERDTQMSPESRMSLDAVSCSFPGKSKKAAVGTYARPVAHPIISIPEWDNTPPVATTPKALTGKRVRPANAHKRAGSFSDSMRDERSRPPVQAVIHKSAEFLTGLPLGGNLVRGNLFPPGKALVEVVAPSTPSEIYRNTLNNSHLSESQKGPSAMSGPGMRKLIGSVRRALGTRNGTANTGASANAVSIPKLALQGAKGATTNRVPGTAVVPQGRLPHSSSQAPVCALRIDLLGAGIAEDFKRAVQESAESDSFRRSRASNTNTITSKQAEDHAVHTEATVTPSRPPNNRAPPSELTTGSKSILIVDDTTPFPNMSGALPIVSGSVDTFSDAFLQPSAGPTPPLTPPEQPQTTPRRSSEILGDRRSQFRSLSLDRTPSLMQDIRSPSELEHSPVSRPLARPSVLSYGRSFRSKQSMSLRKYASFQSGFTRHTKQRSFDATTTYSEREDSSSHGLPSLPPHTLRRRPGGDLRAVANVVDLEPAPLRRYRSMGSISTYDDSERSSYMFGRDSADLVSMMSADLSRSNAPTFSLGALAESSSPPKRPESVNSQRSSKPPMRPSFEKEAAKLAQIPDDDFDDGGVESALLKLEGKYEQRHSDPSITDILRGIPQSPQSLGVKSVDEDSIFSDNEAEEEEKRRHRIKHVDEVGITKTPPLLQAYQPEMAAFTPTHDEEVLKPSVYRPRGLETNTQSFYNQESDPSYSSIPLLDRGLADDSHERRNNHDWSHTSILREPSEERQHDDSFEAESSHPSYDFVNETDSMKRITEGNYEAAIVVQDPSSPQSFLTSDSDDDRSDLSSEMSLEVISNIDGTAPPSLTAAENAAYLQTSRQLLSSANPENLRPELPRSPLIYDNQLYNQNPLTPIITPPTSTGNHANNHNTEELVQSPTQKPSLHLPFILAFSSSLLAQQFTLIEKDALHEIDWKELIEMRWKGLPTPALSWVSFLRTASPRGVEVVSARFNIMVKWAVSEIVLTASMEERARCISKFIHIAAHCRRYKNFATLYQLTVAMSSNELSRLTKTWSLVPEADVKILKELEVLVQPTRNFYALRVEMEKLGLDDACIPFIGVYTQDLLFSAQRPSVIDEDKTKGNSTGPLINFEKCRVQAGIVKSLLRLLEASALYAWGPVEGVTERCLWMARLSDEEIRRRVDALE